MPDFAIDYGSACCDNNHCKTGMFCDAQQKTCSCAQVSGVPPGIYHMALAAWLGEVK